MKRLYITIGLVAALLIGVVIGRRLFPEATSDEQPAAPAAQMAGAADERVAALLRIYRDNASDPTKGDPVSRDRKRRLAEDALRREDPLALQLEQWREQGKDKASQDAEVDALIANEGGG